MHARPRPRRRLFDEPVLHRVDMNVITIRTKLILIANAMLPIPWLPDAAFVVSNTARRYRQSPTAVCEIILREQPFHIRPSNGKVIVVIRQRPDAKQVVGQQHARRHVERPPLSSGDERTGQGSPSNVIAKQWTATMRDQGKEVRRAGLAPSDVVRHSNDDTGARNGG